MMFPHPVPLAASSQLIVPLVIAIVAVLCAVLFFVLKKKTPSAPEGRAETTEALDSAALAAMAEAILAGVGGKGNVTALDCQPPHLRFEIRDFTAINEKAIKAAGAAGLVRPSKTSCQVDLGGSAQAVCDELNKLL